MPPSALSQIDENSSLVHSNADDSMVLPNLFVRRGVPELDFAGEKTPEAWPSPVKACARFSLVDPVPEPGSKTPTPSTPELGSRRCSFTLGDETPYSWPEYSPSFHIDVLQPANLQAAPTVLGSPGINATPMLAPMWPGQIGCPVPIIFDANLMSAANMGVVRSPLMPFPANAAPCPAAKEIPFQTSTATAPAVNSCLAKIRAAMGNKNGLRGVSQDAAGADDACPVAVYVDLSALRERGGARGRGGSGHQGMDRSYPTPSSQTKPNQKGPAIPLERF